MKYYIAFSVHGTNRFYVATKESSGPISALGEGFTPVPSRRADYDHSKDGVKLHWAKLCRKDGHPYTNRAWVVRRFKELEQQGWVRVR